MKNGKRFKVLWPYKQEEIRSWLLAGCPQDVPFEFVAEHDKQCWLNHGQTPRRLTDRGGLSPSEMLAVVEDRRFESMPDADAIARLRAKLEAWELARKEKLR